MTAADRVEPRRILRLHELNRAISDAISTGLGGEVWVVGEVTNLRERNGTRYFDLVEHDDRGRGTVAQLPAAVLRWERAGFDADARSLDGFALADGVEVLVRGLVDFYEPWGRVQLKVRGIDPAHTLGRMQAARDQLLADLVRRGVLRRNADRDLGLPPLRVGVVTAPDSQAEHDLRAVLAASGWGFSLVRAGARVQGPACEGEVVAALAQLAVLHDRLPLDVVLLLRGGGSAVDLQGFDTRGIAEAIVTAPFPIWTGIGHERDRSVADEVAHTAWATPTAVGHGLVTAVDGCEARVRDAVAGLVEGVDRARRRANRELSVHASSLAAGAGAGVRGARISLTRSAGQLAELAGARLRRDAAELDRRRRTLTAAAGRATVPAQRRRLEVLQARIQAADPQAQLARGFSITLDERGEVVRSVAAAPPGSRVRTRLVDGELVARVEASEPRASVVPDPVPPPTSQKDPR
ncbi:MAG: exodeoxyribonuclease VII large subunit [Nitriliruptoraceae bacterium]